MQFRAGGWMTIEQMRVARRGQTTIQLVASSCAAQRCALAKTIGLVWKAAVALLELTPAPAV